MFRKFNLFDTQLENIPDAKSLINTINAHSYNVSRIDNCFQEALLCSHVLLPDGISISWASKVLLNKNIPKIAGEDLFYFEMNRVNKFNGKCFFMGSDEDTLSKIKGRAAIEYPGVQIETYSPPFKPEFSDSDNELMLQKINAFEPDVLFIGLTAPKQEKWAYKHFDSLNVGHVCSIGAVFGFYAGTITRAPQWMLKLNLEWFYRFIREPRRLWRRYLVGNVKFIYFILREKYSPLK